MNKYTLKIQFYCEDEYSDCARLLNNDEFFRAFGDMITKAKILEQTIDRCYGALQFALNYLGEPYDEELGEWWSETMLPKLKSLKENL